MMATVFLKIFMLIFFRKKWPRKVKFVLVNVIDVSSSKL